VSLEPGHQLAHYEVLELIGKGGTGEVYRARNTKLGRDVAIKVLSEEFSQDKERLERFQREARLLAKLNHANIATLHGLEEHHGQLFLVMELFFGETLAERIAEGPIPLDEAIPLFIQIAEGLEAAHEKGIIPRDLKPANMKIGLDGQIKILDFGLAKAFGGEEVSAVESSQSPTRTKGTALGTIMGTASYMSPEQARGKTVDKRTDIWAFGCVLFEALTGTKAFDGETVSDIIGAVLRAEPDAARLPFETPVSVRRLFLRCLRKDGRERLHDIADARLELEERATTSSPAVSSTLASRRRVLALVLTAVMLSSLSMWWMMRHEASPSAPVTRFAVAAPEVYSARRSIALSLDGSRLAYTSEAGVQRRLLLRRMDESDATPVRGAEGSIEYPFFSPDGEWIGFFADGQIQKIPVDGGTPVTLCAAPFHTGASWGDDGFIIFGTNSGLARVSDTGGEPEPLTRVDPDAGELQHRWPDVLPDATAVLFTVRTRTDFRIDVLSLETGERHAVHPGSDGRFSSSGHLIFYRRGSLFAIPFDPIRLETSGADVPFLADVQVIGPASINYGLSRNGTLVYTNRKFLPNAIVWVARDGAPVPVLEGHSFANPRLSPDGDRLAVSIVGPSSSHVWTYDLRLGSLNRFTFEQANHPMSSPDGSWIVFSSERDGAWGIYRKKADGTGGAEKLVSIDSGWMTAAFFASNGTALGFTRVYTSMTGTLIVDLAEDAVPQPLLDEEFSEIHDSLSPDERYFA